MIFRYWDFLRLVWYKLLQCDLADFLCFTLDNGEESLIEEASYAMPCTVLAASEGTRILTPLSGAGAGSQV